MARRKARIPQGKKLQPVPLTMTFDLGILDPSPSDPAINTVRTVFIDLSQCASLVSRKFFRQGLVWATGGMKLTSVATDTDGNPVVGNPAGRLIVRKLPRTWTMSNAWHKGFAAWNEMNNEALESTESIKPKFTDFKIFMDEYHHNVGAGVNYLPISGGTGTYVPEVATAGTWDMSEMTIPTSGATGNATDFEIIAVGESYPGAGASGLDAVSLIEGYASSRGLPDILDPNAPADAADVGPTGTPENWIGALDNEGTDQDKDVLDNMITQNNQAPYPFENDGVHTDTMYPGGANQLSGTQISSFEYITGSTIGGNTHVGPETFPCGLIRIDLLNYDPDNYQKNILQIKLVPGPHRGYMCQPMQEM